MDGPRAFGPHRRRCLQNARSEAHARFLGKEGEPASILFRRCVHFPCTNARNSMDCRFTNSLMLIENHPFEHAAIHLVPILSSMLDDVASFCPTYSTTKWRHQRRMVHVFNIHCDSATIYYDKHLGNASARSPPYYLSPKAPKYSASLPHVCGNSSAKDLSTV